MANDKKPRKVNADMSRWLNVAYRVWLSVFGVLKVIAGAVLTVALICLVCGFVFVNIVGDFLENDIVPNSAMDLGEFDLELNSNLYYFDSNGQVQWYEEVDAVISRQWVEYEDIPENLINAAIAIEDHRFYEHQGVDWITTIKAIGRMFFGDDSAGGSCITQQLVKNVTGESGVTVQRKVLEMFRAIDLEKNYTKEEIMEEYLNRIYLGQMRYGVRSAAAAYFGKEVQNLTLAECASLISITNSPTYYDPYQNPDNNRDRQETVLGEMLRYGFITEEEYDEAMAQELVLKWGIDLEDTMVTCQKDSCQYEGIVKTLNKNNNKYYCPKCGTEVPVEEESNTSGYSYYTDTVLEDVAKALAEKDGVAWNTETRTTYMLQIQRGGYHIYTCLDMAVQNQVDKIYQDLSQIPKARSGQQLQSGIVIKNTAGDIVALCGGVGKEKEVDGWNRATDANLQSGSAIKPLSIYAPGFESGAITPASVILDLPLNYDEGTAWPKNDTRTYSYSRTIYSAVTASVNAVAANTLKKITTDYGYDFAKNKFRLSSLVDEYVGKDGKIHSDNGYAPLAMGAQTWGVKVRDMADAFHTFANDGVYVKGRTFYKVIDSNGNVVLDNTQQTEQILSEKTVDYMNYCLVNATMSGTGREANLYYSHGITTAGKTGTTSSSKDKWYCGFTGYYTAAIWVGYDSPEQIKLVNGGNPAAQLFKKVMGPLHSGLKNVSLYNSSKLRTVNVCLASGKLATDACKADVRVVDGGTFTSIAQASVYKEDIPSESCDKHVSLDYCSGGGVATEYCKHFAEVDSNVTISQKGLVKMTREELDEILKAEKYKLTDTYIRDDYIYLVDKEGKDDVFIGLKNDLKQTVEAPYKVCSAHTQKAWEEYQAAHPEEPTEPSEPTEPTDPIFPGMDEDPFGWLFP